MYVYMYVCMYVCVNLFWFLMLRQEKEQQEEDLLGDCKTARFEQILQWAKNYKVYENAMLAKADEAVTKFLLRETEKMMKEHGHEEMLLRARQVILLHTYSTCRTNIHSFVMIYQTCIYMLWTPLH